LSFKPDKKQLQEIEQIVEEVRSTLKRSELFLEFCKLVNPELWINYAKTWLGLQKEWDKSGFTTVDPRLKKKEKKEDEELDEILEMAEDTAKTIKENKETNQHKPWSWSKDEYDLE